MQNILFGAEARHKLKIGIDAVADCVKVTLGAMGRTVMYKNLNQMPRHTKDGVTCAQEVAKRFLNADQLEATGAFVILQASAKTAKEAGDGTTATCVLMQSIVHGCMGALKNGANPVALGAGIRIATDRVVGEIKKQAARIESDDAKLLQVATIACNNDGEIGKLIAEAFGTLGKDAIISMGEPLGIDSSLKINKGLRINKGWTSPHYVNNSAKQTCDFENPFVLIYENKIANANDVMAGGKIFDQIAKQGRPVLFICDGIDEQTKASLILSNSKAMLKVCYINIPGIGDENKKDLLEDIAAVTGATICGYQRGVKASQIDIKQCGSVKRVVVTSEHTTFYNSDEKEIVDRIESRVTTLKAQLDTMKSAEGASEERAQFSIAQVQERIAKLSGGIAIIHVGGHSEMEIGEKRDRVDDAIRATQSALQEGVVIGGGMALLKIGTDFKNDLSGDARIGADIIIKSLFTPAKQIAYNCAVEKFSLKYKLLKLFGNYSNSELFILNIQRLRKIYGDSLGYNAKTGMYEDLNRVGILDAAKVVRCSIENATAQSLVILSSECLMVEELLPSN